jgi:hypothetical protein
MNITFWSGSLEGRDHSEDIGIDGRVILEWILGRKDRDRIAVNCVNVPHARNHTGTN